jgi:hypothetical protein
VPRLPHSLTAFLPLVVVTITAFTTDNVIVITFFTAVLNTNP